MRCRRANAQASRSAVRLGVCAVLFLGLARLCAGETTEYVIRTWQTEDGLPQDSVSAIRQTRDGYLWLGTFNGLARFDGVSFTVFTSARTPGLHSDNINALYEDQAGRLWIATEGGGLSSFQNRRFRALLGPSQPGSAIVRALAEDGRGVLWVGTAAGLFRRDGESLVPATFAGQPDDPGSVADLAVERDGTVWVGARNGLFQVRDGRLRREADFVGGARLGGGSQGVVWAGSRESGLVRCADGQATPVPGFAGYDFACLLQARDGPLWIGSSRRGLSRWQEGTRVDYTAREGLLSDDIVSVAEDREGNLWVGTNGGGLHRLRKKSLQNYSERDGLPGNDVVTLLEDRRGRTWIGSYGQGVSVFDGERFQRLEGLPGAGSDVYAMCETRDGRVLLGTSSGELYTWKDERLDTKELLPDEGARVIFEDRSGGLWLGSRLAGLRHRQANQTVRYSTAEGLGDNYVTAIAEDAQGAIWVGTKRGLNRFRQGRFERFSRKEGLGSEIIQTLVVDSAGVLWVGTAGGGLARYRDGRFSTVTSEQGLNNDVIGQVLDDGHGSFWLGSNAGLLRLSRPDLQGCLDGRARRMRGLMLGRAEGMLNPECAGSFQTSCLKARDGKLWFATVGGLVVVNPDALTINPKPPPVVIQHVSACGDAIEPAPPGPEDELPLFVIPPGGSRIEVRFTGLSLIAPERVRFRFRLEGVDEDWSEPQSTRSAQYTGLSPRTYRFEVVACNNDGVWNRTGAGLLLAVQPFVWQEWWFQLAAALAGLGLVLGLVRVAHDRNLRRRLAEVERRNEHLRAEALSAANRQLQARTEQLEEALANVKTLSGLIPICASCKKVRDDKGFWDRVETYVQQRSDARFTHGICPECLRKMYPQYADDAPQRGTPAATATVTDPSDASRTLG